MVFMFASTFFPDQRGLLCNAGRKKVKGKNTIGKVIDFLVIFGVLGALSSSLGLAVPLFTGGLNVLFNTPVNAVSQVGCIVFIAVVYSITSFLGTKKGMQTISNIASVTWRGFPAVCIVYRTNHLYFEKYRQTRSVI